MGNTYIGIDMSLSSTAITMLVDETYYYFSFLKDYKPKSKWCKLVEPFTTIIPVEYSYGTEKNYSTQEGIKIKEYRKTTTQIIDTISPYIKGQLIVGMETYSLNSMAGHLVDLVRLGTLLQDKLIGEFDANIDFLSPSTLKKETCILSYGVDMKGRCYSPIGIAGGSFKKHQMLEALKDYNKTSPLNDFLKYHSDEILTLKKIPSPIDDIVDSSCCLEVVLKK
jgi:hypothetical protein